MINIYKPDGDILIKDIPITESSEHIQELSKSDYIKMVWSDVVCTVIPIGSYIQPYGEDGHKYQVLKTYKPKAKDEMEYQYEVEFHHPKMSLGYIPTILKTKNNAGQDIDETDWSYTGSLTGEYGIAKKICTIIKEQTINEQAYGSTGLVFTYALITGSTIEPSATMTFSACDILSALNIIANAYDTEYHIDWDDRIIYFGKISIGTPILLEEGKNIGIASISQSKEDSANYYVVRGGTRNITTKTSLGSNIETDTRLAIPDIDKRTDDTYEPKLKKILIFDDVYPKLDLYVYNVRSRIRRLLDDNNNEIILEYNADGTPKTYRMYGIYYLRLAWYDSSNGEWHDFAAPKSIVVNGKKLTASFEPNQNGHSALSGRDFEMIYHEKDKSISSSEYDTGIEIKAGDYEICFEKDGDLIIPDINTLQPWGVVDSDGQPVKSQNGDKVVLYNILMDDDTDTTNANPYIESAKVELKSEADKEIARLRSDLNNYTFKKRPDIDIDGLNIGGAITYKSVSGYTLQTRIIKLVSKIDYPDIIEITVGNLAVKGNTETLKEEVISANNDISTMSAMSDAVSNMTTSLQNAQNAMNEAMAKIKDMWQFDANGNIYTPYNAYSQKGLSAYGFGEGSEPSGSIVAWSQIVSEGTCIAQITIDGVTTNVYAPTGGGGGGGVNSWTDIADRPSWLDSYLGTNKPAVSLFTNDAGYLTEHQSLDGYLTSANAATLYLGKNDTASKATRLASDDTKNIWGQTYWSGGQPQAVSGDFTIKNHLIKSINNSAATMIQFSRSDNSQLFSIDYNGYGAISMYSGTNSAAPTLHLMRGGNVGLGTKTPAEKLEVVGNAKLNTENGTYIQIGGARIVWDSANSALKVICSDNSTAANLYATGGISAYQYGAATPDIVVNFTDLKDIPTNPTANMAWGWDGQKWTQIEVGVTELSWSAITGKPTTLSGYGITNAYTKSEIDTLLSGKANKATTLAGYGITDAYTKTEADTLLSGKADKADSDSKYVTGLGTSGESLTWTKNGITSNITVPFATKVDQLKTSRNIWGQPFNGSADVTGAMTGVTTIDGALYLTTSVKGSLASQIGIVNAADGIDWQFGLKNTTTAETNGVGIKFGFGSLTASSYWSGIASVAENSTASRTGLALYTRQAERMRITYEGNIGVGTTSPTEQIHVYTSGANTRFLQFENNVITNEDGTTSSQKFKVGISTSGYASIWHTESNFIRLGTNALERMRITADGLVGIGTGAPTEKLDVNGSINVARSKTDGGYKIGGTTVLRNNSSNTNVFLSANSGGIYLRPNGTQEASGQIYIDTDGALHIGSIILSEDSTNKALKVSHATSGTNANLYTTGGLSAYQYGAATQELVATFSDLKDADIQSVPTTAVGKAWGVVSGSGSSAVFGWIETGKTYTGSTYIKVDGTQISIQGKIPDANISSAATWNGKQDNLNGNYVSSFGGKTGAITLSDVLSAAQLNAVNSGITSTKVSNYDTAYGWGNHAAAGYALSSDLSAHAGNTDIHITSSERTAWGAKYDKPAGGIPNSDLANSSIKLWGTTTALGGTRSGNMSSVGNIAFSGSGKNIGSIAYFDTTNKRLGIGVAPDVYTLDVRGDIRSTSSIYTQYLRNIVDGTMYISNRASDKDIEIWTNAGQNYKRLTIDGTNGNTSIWKDGGTEWLRMDSANKMLKLGTDVSGTAKTNYGNIWWDETNKAFCFEGSLYATGGIAAYSMLGTGAGDVELANLTLTNNLTVGNTLKIGDDDSVPGEISNVLTDDGYQLVFNPDDSVKFTCDLYSTGSIYIGNNNYSKLYIGSDGDRYGIEDIHSDGTNVYIKINGKTYKLANA